MRRCRWGRDMVLNEADTRAKLIDPKIKAVGWGETHIEREHHVVKGRAFTAGRIYLVGEESRRRPPRRADYLFRVHNALPIAVLEAKDESHSVDAGLEQAKGYALTLGLPFAFSSNGRAFVEFDFFLNRSRERKEFPSPDELIARWERHSQTVNGGTARHICRQAPGGNKPPSCPLLWRSDDAREDLSRRADQLQQGQEGPSSVDERRPEFRRTLYDDV
jgi:type I site-specific restriction endonuclease